MLMLLVMCLMLFIGSTSTAAAPPRSSPPTHINQSHHRPPLEPSQSAARPQQSGSQLVVRPAPDDGLLLVNGTGEVRLDRTPTDDEINWLWHKVRTCLSSSRSTSNHGSSPITNPSTGNSASPSITNTASNPADTQVSGRHNPTVPNSSSVAGQGTSSSGKPVVSRTYIDGTVTNTTTSSRKPVVSKTYIGGTAINTTGSSGSSCKPVVTKTYITGSVFNTTGQGSSPTGSSRKSVVSKTYIDGTAITVSSHRRVPGSTHSQYVNNYMGSGLPARRRLVTVDTLGRLVQRRLPRRPLSGVTRQPVPAVNTRASSAPVTPARTNSPGQSMYLCQTVAFVRC